MAENICWESRANDDSKFFKELHEQHDRYNYDRMLPLFAENGGNFIRVWMCSFNFPIDQHDHFNNLRYTPSDEYYNPSAVERLDCFVDLCERLGIHVMLCMGQGAVPADREFFNGEPQAQRYICLLYTSSRPLSRRPPGGNLRSRPIRHRRRAG